jgi:hypothetical protein
MYPPSKYYNYTLAKFFFFLRKKKEKRKKRWLSKVEIAAFANPPKLQPPP